MFTRKNFPLVLLLLAFGVLLWYGLSAKLARGDTLPASCVELTDKLDNTRSEMSKTLDNFGITSCERRAHFHMLTVEFVAISKRFQQVCPPIRIPDSLKDLVCDDSCLAQEIARTKEVMDEHCRQ